MNAKIEIMSRFSDVPGTAPLFLADLTLWFDWHRSRKTMPAAWDGYSLPDVARALGVPIWVTVKPWRMNLSDVSTAVEEDEETRTIRYETGSGVIASRWKLGRDGDWWQTEYPVKTKADLQIVLELVNSRSYEIDKEGMLNTLRQVGGDGVVALELPRQPLSEVLHAFVGWSDGLLFLRESAIGDIVTVLDSQLERVVQEVAGLPADVVLAPDNLDGQFISPRAFQSFMSEGYRKTSQMVHSHNKPLVVHIGGPIKRLLPLLAQAGVDGFEGISGPPQSDLTLAAARELVGQGHTLWGGIAQDVLLATYDEHEFEFQVLLAAQHGEAAGRTLAGIADRVPVFADLDRLQAIPALLKRSATN